jgi:hypothetical protein
MLIEKAMNDIGLNELRSEHENIHIVIEKYLNELS